MNQSIGKLISTVYRQLNIILNNRFSRYGIGAGQYAYYLTVADCEGKTQFQVSCALNVNKATANKALKKLEESGFIETVIDKKDRRLHRLYLTDRGRSILPAIREELKECTELLGSGMSEENRSAFTGFLEIAASNARVEVENIRSCKQDEGK